MPKYGIHYIVLEAARGELLANPANSLANRRGRILQDNLPYASLGAIGPDLFFYAPDYKLMEVLVPFNDKYRAVKDLYKKVKQPLEKGWDLLEPYVDEVLDEVPVLDEIVTILKQIGSIDKLISAAQTELYKSAVVVFLGLDARFEGYTDLPRGLFQALFESGTQSGLEEPDWYWFDMLHYRRTGEFAQVLLSLAGNDEELQAYALGYMSHIATDVVGHPYVNQICAAPYRISVQRHVTAENYMDQWKWSSHFDENIRHTLVERYDLLPTMSDDLANLLWRSLMKTYGPVAHPMGKGGEDITAAQSQQFDWGFLTPDDIKATYGLLRTFMEVLGDNEDLRPEEPYPGADEDLAQLNESLDLFDPPPALPLPPLPDCDWEGIFSDPGGACFEAFVDDIRVWMAMVQDFLDWARETGRKALNLALDVALNPLPMTPTRYLMLLLYAWQLQLYAGFRALNGVMARAGLAYPEPDEARLTSPLANSLITPALAWSNPKEQRFPRLRPRGQSHLIPPNCARDEVPARLRSYIDNDVQFCCEQPLTEPAFYPTTTSTTPDIFISEPGFDPAAVSKYAAARNPEETHDLHRTRETIGNAPQFTAWMIEHAANPASAGIQGAVFCNWNLDADRGYGYKTWDGMPPLCNPGALGVSFRFSGDGTDTGDFPGRKFADFFPRVWPDGTAVHAPPTGGVRYVGEKKLEDCFLTSLNAAESSIPSFYTDVSSTGSVADWARLVPDRLRLRTQNYLRNVRFVNGIRTDHYGCVYDMDNLRHALRMAMGSQGVAGAPGVVAMHNRTGGVLMDVLESIPDKVHAYLLWAHIRQGIGSMPTIHNATTVGMVALLHHAMEENRRLFIVGYSQGTLITGNAVMTFAAMGQQQADFLRDRVKLMHLAVVHYPWVMAHIKSLLGPDRYIAYRRTGDPLATALSGPANVGPVGNQFPEPFMDPVDRDFFTNPRLTPDYMIEALARVKNASTGLLGEVKAILGNVFEDPTLGQVTEPHAMPNYLNDVLQDVANDNDVHGVKTREFLFG